MDAIRTEGLSKRFGRTLALDDLTLAVPPGEVFGFLGPNGAGKDPRRNNFTSLRRVVREQGVVPLAVEVVALQG
jgi:ABC-type uncharacterized transport system ATPase subunit